MYSNITATKCEDLLADEKLDMIAVPLSRSSITSERVTAAMHAISAMCKNPERALMFLELVNTDETLSNLINYGVEGVHYKKAGKATITQLPRGVEKYNPDSQWMFGNETITYSLPERTSKAWTTLDESVKKAIASPLLGFSFDPEPVAVEIHNLNDITNKYVNDLSIGKVNPTSTLTKMNNELKNAGLQKVLTEMQQQVDKFKKSN
jgi:putative aldouronate transport system substrate-binding protein